ncbi:MAG: serine dehydratase beta chain, partial [Pseudomonadota bacterium]
MPWWSSPPNPANWGVSEMVTSLFDLFKIGIGPSSSHTVGPMVAARTFVLDLDTQGLFERVARVRTELYGSLALTGKGHATDSAIILGLLGETPSGVDPDAVPSLLANVREGHQLNLGGSRVIGFDEEQDLIFNYGERLPEHSNGMVLSAFDAGGDTLMSESFFSVGGGFVVTRDGMHDEAPISNVKLPHPFASASDLLEIGDRTGLSIAQIMLEDERAWRDDAEIAAGIVAVFNAMEGSIDRGTRPPGTLPGGLTVRRRRAPARGSGFRTSIPLRRRAELSHTVYRQRHALQRCCAGERPEIDPFRPRATVCD